MPDDNPPTRPASWRYDRLCDGCHKPMIGIMKGAMQPPRTHCQECEYLADATQSRKG